MKSIKLEGNVGRVPTSLWLWNIFSSTENLTYHTILSYTFYNVTKNTRKSFVFIQNSLSKTFSMNGRYQDVLTLSLKGKCRFKIVDFSRFAANAHRNLYTNVLSIVYPKYLPWPYSTVCIEFPFVYTTIC